MCGCYTYRQSHCTDITFAPFISLKSWEEQKSIFQYAIQWNGIRCPDGYTNMKTYWTAMWLTRSPLRPSKPLSPGGPMWPGTPVLNSNHKLKANRIFTIRHSAETYPVVLVAQLPATKSILFSFEDQTISCSFIYKSKLTYSKCDETGCAWGIWGASAIPSSCRLRILRYF